MKLALTSCIVVSRDLFREVWLAGIVSWSALPLNGVADVSVNSIQTLDSFFETLNGERGSCK